MYPNLEKAVNTIRETTFPDLVIVEVCGFCNLHCIMCPYPNLKRKKGIMNWNMYKKIVDEIAEKSPSTQLWPAIMGEPLLNKKIYDYISYAKDRGIKDVILNTNGTLLFPELYNKLIETKLDKIIIGIDAFNENTYNNIRIGGDFKIVKDNIKNIIAINKKLKTDKKLKINKRLKTDEIKIPEIILQFIEMKENIEELEKFKEYWLSEGVTLKIRKRLGWGTCTDSYDMDISPNSQERVPCPWLMRTVSIHWTGNVSQCDADYEGIYSVGNIKDQTIEELWNGEFKLRRIRHWNKDFNFNPCKECKDWQAGLSEWYYP